MAWRDYRDLLQQMEFDMQRFTEETLMTFLEHPANMHRFWQPAADVHETDDGMVVKLELAGVTVSSVTVSLSGDGRTLTVAGSRAEGRDERISRTGCHQLEIYFGPFERSFDVPFDLAIDRDRIGATLRDGFLTITLPRRAPEAIIIQTIPIAVQSE